MVEETGVPGGNHRYVIRAEKTLVYGATYLVPRAWIEPTPRTDIGYRPVSHTRQTRREPLGHRVPPFLGDSRQKCNAPKNHVGFFSVENER
jgi:hypothetical protein